MICDAVTSVDEDGEPAFPAMNGGLGSRPKWFGCGENAGTATPRPERCGPSEDGIFVDIEDHP